MTREEREQIIKKAGVLEGMSMMLIPCSKEMIFLANQLMDVSLDLEMIACGVDDCEINIDKGCDGCDRN